MKVTVLGGRGFIGAHVVNRLRERGADVAVAGRSDPVYPCEVAVHMFVMNAAGAADFLTNYGPVARKLVLASSGDVYRAYGIFTRLETGPIDNSQLTEESPLRTVLHPYPQYPDYDKIPAERALLAAGPANCVLRLPAVYGPGDRHHRVGTWIQHPQAGSTWRWTHGYVENVADAMALAALDRRADGRIFNVGEAHTPTQFERMEAWGDAAGCRNHVVADTEEPPYDFLQNLVMNSARLRGELGFEDIVSDREGVERSVAWEVQSGYARRPS